MLSAKQRLLQQGSGWLLPVGLLVCWWQASLHGWMSEQILPSPALVLESARDFIGEDLLRELPISLWRLAVGLAGGIALGFLLGMVFGLSQTVHRLLMPLFTVLVQIPTLAWIPLLMLMLGIGEALKLTVLIKAVTVPVALYTCAGVQQIPPGLKEVALSLRLSPWVYGQRLVLPSLLPFLMTGIRLAFSQGWVSLIAVELLASSEGLGYLLVQSRQLFMLDLVYVCVVVIGVLGFAGEGLLLSLSRRWISWPAPVTGAGKVTSPGTRDLYGWLLPLTLIMIWQLACAVGWLNSAFFASPLTVGQTLCSGLLQGILASELAASLWRMLLGFTVGAVAGLLLGGITGSSVWADRVFTPLFSALRSVAIFAWLPLITAWFGLGESARVAFISLASFFPVLLATHQGIAQLPPTLQEVATALRLSPLSRLRHLVLPGMLPHLFTGLRLGMMHAWVGTIGAEYFVSSGEGLGSMMMRAQQLLAADRILAGIVLIALVAAFISWAIGRIERRLTAWRYD